MTLEIKELAAQFGEHSDRVMDVLEKATMKVKCLDEQLFSLEQKFASAEHYGGGTPSQPESWGRQFVSSPELKNFADNHSRPGRYRLDVKSAITSAAGSGGDLGTAYRDGLVAMPKRRMVVRDLLPTIAVTSGSVEYPKQTERTNAAATVAEAALKPESSYAFELETTPIRTIAHWIPASRQILDDAPQLAGLIDSELRYGLGLREDAQLLLGDGVGQNLLGLIPQATAFTAPITITTPNSIDMIALGILQSALADFPADGIVLHPSDWMRMRLIKNTDGEYLLGDPASNVTPVLFGLPVVLTTAIQADTWLVGNFQAAAVLYDRWAPRVEISTEHADFFVRNLVAILAEERIGLAVKQSAALTTGDFGVSP